MLLMYRCRCACVHEMASTRSRREIQAKSPNPSDVEDPGSDSDYSPGSLIIDMGADGVCVCVCVCACVRACVRACVCECVPVCA